MGGFVGDIVFYLIGFYGGKKILNRLAIKKKSLSGAIDRASVFLRKHEGNAVLWGRFPAFIGKYVMVVAGMLSFSFYRFLLFSAVGGLLMVAVYGIPYYLLGSELNQFFGIKTLTLYLTVVVLVLNIVASWIWAELKKRRG